MSVRRLDPSQPTAAFAFTPENLTWAKRTVAKYPQGKQASAVIPLLWRAQEQNAGWVTRPILEYIGDMLDMAYIRVLEVATFYTMFQLSPVGSKAHIQVCGTTPCMLRGAENLKAVCQSKIHHEPHHLNADGTLSWEEVECLGACVNAPMVQVWKDTYEDLTPETLASLIDDWQAGRKTQPGPQNGRQFSMPEGGGTALTDPSLYGKQRTFARVEAPPPPTPASPAAPPAPAQIANPAVVAPMAPAVKPAPAAPPSKYVDLLAQQIKEKKELKAKKAEPATPKASAGKATKAPVTPASAKVSRKK